MNPLLCLDANAFPIASVVERFNKMNESFNNKDYGETVNYARSMIESTCKYIYKQITNKEMSSGIPFPKMIRSTLERMNSEIYVDLTKDISEECGVCVDSIVNLFRSVGSVRNQTSVSHGSAVRTRSISELEAKFIAHISSSFVIFY